MLLKDFFEQGGRQLFQNSRLTLISIVYAGYYFQITWPLPIWTKLFKICIFCSAILLALMITTDMLVTSIRCSTCRNELGKVYPVISNKWPDFPIFKFHCHIVSLEAGAELRLYERWILEIKTYKRKEAEMNTERAKVTVLAISCGEQWDKVTDFQIFMQEVLPYPIRDLFFFYGSRKNFYSFFFFWCW